MGIRKGSLYSAIKPFFDPGRPRLPTDATVSVLTEPGPFPSQVRSQIGQRRAFRFQNSEYP
ncbi:hypothetical protein BMS3Bbin12_00995 [bacterium BMS3Bbin12]|nr:hypothetical protein BMS3Abin12_01457 [bacterium BMS3Abin12]GBE47827.1 hypothetical protein BMS3Bbin12_00995 [bacterium BMS3Bbin12]GBE51074.1 hypothetical protein BMS3Bbin13_02028 [bacterium BMS3Bbin13]